MYDYLMLQSMCCVCLGFEEDGYLVATLCCPDHVMARASSAPPSGFGIPLLCVGVVNLPIGQLTRA